MIIYYSDGEIGCQALCDELSPAQKNSWKERLVALENMASSQILLMLLDVLHEYLSFNNIDEEASSKRQDLTIEDKLIDVNNNLATKNDNGDLSVDKKAYPCKYQQTTACKSRNFAADVDERISKRAKARSNCSNVKNCSASLGCDGCPNCVSEEFAVVSTKNVGLSTKETQDKTTCCPVIYEKSRKLYRDSNNDGYVSELSDQRHIGL